MLWTGTVETGHGIATNKCVWPQPGWHPGTLNLRGEPIHQRLRWQFPAGWETEHWMPYIIPAILIVNQNCEPVMAGMNTLDNTIELVAREHLRTKHNIQNGERVLVHINNWYLL